MREIAALPWNGYNVVSTFSGCGGSCLGYRMAGFRVIWANEFIPAAREVYRANAAPGSILDENDIRDVKPETILEACGLEEGQLDLFDGSPPCSAFSTAGRREEGWGKVKPYSGTKQRVDDLFFEYVRILRGLKPKVFVAENVSGLVKGTARGYFLLILEALKECGYRVACRVLDAHRLGVPQIRQRTIFVGVREDLQLDPVHPSPLPYVYTIRDAIKGLSEPNRSEPMWLKEGSLGLERWRATQPGKALGVKTAFTHTRQTLDRPANTLTTKNDLYHWEQPRTLSIPECKRFSTFPDDFVISGSYGQQWERIGRAVPPLMMRAIAQTVRDQILARC